MVGKMIDIDVKMVIDYNLMGSEWYLITDILTPQEKSIIQHNRNVEIPQNNRIEQYIKQRKTINERNRRKKYTTQK